MINFLIFLLIWMIVGSFILFSIDNEKQELYEWVSKTPYGLSAITILLWPVIVFVVIKNKVGK